MSPTNPDLRRSRPQDAGCGVNDIDGKVARLVDDMFDTLYDQRQRHRLAAPQIGVQKQIFVWEIATNRWPSSTPRSSRASGEWVYDEGCLSIPGLYVEMLRPNGC